MRKRTEGEKNGGYNFLKALLVFIKAIEAFVKDPVKAARVVNRYDLQVPTSKQSLASSSNLADISYVAVRRSNSLVASFVLSEVNGWKRLPPSFVLKRSCRLAKEVSWQNSQTRKLVL